MAALSLLPKSEHPASLSHHAAAQAAPVSESSAVRTCIEVRVRMLARAALCKQCKGKITPPKMASVIRASVMRAHLKAIVSIAANSIEASARKA
eukprot:6186283-Pleurochrysis_carterae.AAC.4